jgi:hypothetical protein
MGGDGKHAKRACIHKREEEGQTRKHRKMETNSGCRTTQGQDAKDAEPSSRLSLPSAFFFLPFSLPPSLYPSHTHSLHL